MKKQFADLSGKKFGFLTAIRLAEKCGNERTRWICQCDCGNITEVFTSNLTRLHTKSCGCHKKANYKTMNLTHGATAGKMGDKNSYPSSYKTWCSMKQRCYDHNLPQYKYYGGRGIAVCERWHDYANFFSDMGEPPQGMSLDRIDNNGSYSPENCRWTDMKTQQRNKTNAHLITYQGETKSLAEWADHFGISRGKLHNRIFRGWDICRAFTQPYRKAPSRTICISDQ